MGTKDTITKDYMADNRVFADVFNHMLYKGKNVIDPDTLHPLDTTALAVPYGSGTSEVPVQKFRDEFKSLNVMHDDSTEIHILSYGTYYSTLLYIATYFFAVFWMAHLLLYLIWHIDQTEPIEHSVDVSHSPDIAQSFGSLYYFFFNILQCQQY